MMVVMVMMRLCAVKGLLFHFRIAHYCSPQPTAPYHHRSELFRTGRRNLNWAARNLSRSFFFFFLRFDTSAVVFPAQVLQNNLCVHTFALCLIAFVFYSMKKATLRKPSLISMFVVLRLRDRDSSIGASDSSPSPPMHGVQHGRLGPTAAAEAAQHG